MSGNEWQDVFCGREKELQFLKDKWKQVSNSEKAEPQVVVLLAESGMGKTRLVQEFYSWLVEKEDREGYWPKKLGSEVENLRVNPDFSKADNRPAMPFLWWGVRFNGSQDRNQHVGSSLPTYIPHLVPHFYELHAARERASLILNGSGLLINLATLGSIQLVQSISELGNLGFSAAVLARDKYLSKKDKINKGSVKNIQNSHLRDQVDILYQDFRSMMTPSLDGGIAFEDAFKVIKGKVGLESVMATMEAVPTVIFLDDAQWIDEDALSLITKLMEDAKSNNWPLMIIATHWESEWKKKEVGSGSGSKFVSFVRSHSADLKFLSKTDGLETMLKSAFPNLTDKQRKIIVDRTDGNPGYMEAIIRDLSDEVEYFIEENFNNSLTKEGEEYIQRQECDFFNITEKRFKKLPLELRKALRWATYQGAEFSEILGISMYRKMVGSDDIIDFDVAELPFCFISRNDVSLSEFRQRIFFEVANKRLKSNSGELAKLNAALQEIIVEWIDQGGLRNASGAEIEFVAKLAMKYFDRSDRDNFFRLLARTFDLYRSTKQIRDAINISNVIWQSIDVDSVIGFEIIPLKAQLDSMFMADIISNTERMKQLKWLGDYSKYIYQNRAINVSNFAFQQSWLLIAAGSVCIRDGKLNEAHGLFKDAYNMLNRIQSKFSLTENIKEDLRGLEDTINEVQCLFSSVYFLRKLLSSYLSESLSFCDFLFHENSTIRWSATIDNILHEFIETISLSLECEISNEVLDFFLQEKSKEHQLSTSLNKDAFIEAKNEIDTLAIEMLPNLLPEIVTGILEQFQSLCQFFDLELNENGKPIVKTEIEMPDSTYGESKTYIPSLAVPMIKEIEKNMGEEDEVIEQYKGEWEVYGSYGRIISVQCFSEQTMYEKILRYLQIPFIFANDYERWINDEPLNDVELVTEYHVFRPAMSSAKLEAVDAECVLNEYKPGDEILHSIDHGIDFALWNKIIDWDAVKTKLAQMPKEEPSALYDVYDKWGSGDFVDGGDSTDTSTDGIPF